MSIVNTPQLRSLYESAQYNPEWASTRLWEHLFRHYFFSEKEWVISSQQPPTQDPSDLRRVDLVVEDFSDAAGFTTVLFMEAKRASVKQSDIDEVEKQAYDAACAYCGTLPEPRPIWTMTCIGGTARVWIFDISSDYLLPYIPNTAGISEEKEYLDIRTHGLDLQGAMNFIKINRIPPSETVQASSSFVQSPAQQAAWHNFPNTAVGSAASSSMQSQGQGRTVRELAEYGAQPIPLRQQDWVKVEMLGMLGTHGKSFTIKLQDSREQKVSTTGWTQQYRIRRDGDDSYAEACFAKVLKDGIVYYVPDEDVP